MNTVPPASFVNMHRIGRVLHSEGPLPEERVLHAVRREVSAYEARRVLAHLQKLKHVNEEDGLLDISPTLRDHYDDVALRVASQNQDLPLTPPRLQFDFKPLSPRNIPSSRGTRPDAPWREVPSFKTLAGFP